MGRDGSKGAMRAGFTAEHWPPEIGLVRGHYVFSGQRHFASTIFADQILIVGWRLSKEAWPPVGSLSATRCTNVLVLFLLFLCCLSQVLLALLICILAPVLPAVGMAPHVPARDANRIELSGS